MEGRTFLTITPANIITVMILGLIGYAILAGASMLYQKISPGGSPIGAATSS